MKKLCIFDFDGTLIDSVDDVVMCFNKALSIYDLPTLTREDYIGYLGGNIDEIVSLVSKLPFKISDENCTDLAMAVAMANNNVIDGMFLYDLENGIISYKFTSNYKDSVLGEGLFEFMIGCAIKTIDDYNDKFYLISKKMLGLEEFVQEEKRKRG